MPMFTKLKKKIQDEGSVSPGGASSDTRNIIPKVTKLPSPGPGIASPVKMDFPGGANMYRRDSVQGDVDTMSICSEVSDVRDTASKEDMLKKILKKNEQIKKLETKITELAAMIKDRNKNIEKLEHAVEKQKQESVQQMEDLNLKLEKNKEGILEEASDQFKNDIKSLQQEREELLKKLSKANEYRNKFLKQEEETEEFTGLTTQEMAKIKHMLLNAQEDLQVCQKELQKKSTDCENLYKRVTHLEEEIESLMQQITSITSRSEELEEENSINRVSLEQLQDIKKESDNKNDVLRIRQEALEKLQQSYDVLHRNSDLHQNKMTKLVEEKDEHISHLRERIETLEQRLKDGELSGDDRTKALEKQREQLEERLAESRNHLSQIKSTWNDKVSHMESQISHLNNKIAEDNEELLNNRKELENNKQHFHNQVEQAQQKLQQSDKDALKYLNVITAKDQELDKVIKEHKSELLREKLHWTSLETELREKITDLHRDIDTLQKTRDHEKHVAQQKISTMESSQEEWLEKQIDTEKQITGFEDKIQELKTKLQNKVKEIGNAGSKDIVIKDLKKQIKVLEDQVSEEKENALKIQTELRDLDKELHICTDEKDSLLLRNAQLSQEHESLKRKVKDRENDLETELQQKNISIAGLEQVLLDMQYEAEQNKQKIKELESQQMVAITEIESEEIKTLQKEVQELEDQLLDRNKTIKKQQHRMADLKKTLQRELNVQALPNDEDSNTSAVIPHHHNMKDQPVITRSALNGIGHPPQNFNSSSRDLTSVHSSNLAGDRVNGSHSISNSVSVNTDQRRLYEDASDFSASDAENISYSTSNKNKKKFSFANSMNFKGGNLTRTYAGVQYDRDINFDYLKHVIMKFMLSREAESVHLIKAVAVLLDFSIEEQKMMKETLEYKMSWFGTRPSLGQGQNSKFIPPSL